MDHTITASIIISSYNYDPFLRATIDSALAQTYRHLEVIVVDDGSIDDSRKIIASYGDKIKPLLKQNGGQASAFNVGFEVSKGEVIFFLDSDDTLFPTAVANVIGAFHDSNVVKAHWPMAEIDESGMETGGFFPTGELAEGNLLNDLVKYGPEKCGGPPYSPPNSGNAWSRKFLEQVLPMPLAFNACADFYLFVLAPVFGELRRLMATQGCYRVHGNNYSLKPLAESIYEYFVWFEQACLTLHQHLQKKGITADPDVWKKNFWYHKLHTVMQEITAIVSPATSFILIDENLWKFNDFGSAYHRLPFLEQYGKSWPPANDEEAIEEIKRLQQKGAWFIIFAWPAFWWLDYYSGMYEYLQLNYECTVKNERLVIFDLQKKIINKSDVKKKVSLNVKANISE